MKKNPLLPLSISLALVLAAPGLPAYQALAASLEQGPAPAGRSISAPLAPWTQAVADLSYHLSLAPQQGATANLAQALNQARVQTMVDGAAPGHYAFLRHLDPRWAADPVQFARQTPEFQAKLLAEAAAKVWAELEPQARALVAVAEKRELAPAEEEAVLSLSQAWFYLSPETGGELRALAFEIKGGRAVSGARRMAESLAGRSRKPEETPASAANAEFGYLFRDVEALANLMPLGDSDAERKAFMGQVLAPYAARRLAEAADRMEARGWDREDLLKPVLSRQDLVFGLIAPRELVEPLRASGQWTDLVAGLSLAAAEQLAAALPARPARKILSEAGADHNLALAIPSWHPLHGAHETVGDWLKAAYNDPPAFKSRGGIPLFTLFGIPVRAQTSFLAILAFGTWQATTMLFPYLSPHHSAATYWLQGIAATVLLYASVVAHEFGHALVARRFGVGTREIVLHILGGLAAIDREIRKPMAEFLIALAGPVVSFLLGVGSFALLTLLHGHPLLRPVLWYLGFSNLLMAVFNMIPAFPMDGGRVLRAALAALRKDHYKATRAAAKLSAFFAYGFLGLGLWSVVHGNLGGIMMVLLGTMLKAAAGAAARHPGTELVEKTPSRRGAP